MADTNDESATKLINENYQPSMSTEYNFHQNENNNDYHYVQNNFNDDEQTSSSSSIATTNNQIQSNHIDNDNDLIMMNNNNNDNKQEESCNHEMMKPYMTKITTIIHTNNNMNNRINGNNNDDNDDEHEHNDELVDEKIDYKNDTNDMNHNDNESEWKSLFNHLLIYNEYIMDETMKKISIYEKEISQKDDELKKSNLIIDQLGKDINDIEKNYYEIHSRYDTLRTLTKELDERLTLRVSNNKELKNQLKEKIDENNRLKQELNEAAANQRANSEAVSLKAQIKLLEMKVNSFQSQLEQKNRENEELSNIVNELINNNNNNKK